MSRVPSSKRCDATVIVRGIRRQCKNRHLVWGKRCQKHRRIVL